METLLSAASERLVWQRAQLAEPVKSSIIKLARRRPAKVFVGVTIVVVGFVAVVIVPVVVVGVVVTGWDW
ncbi:hypothetical protein ACFLYB_03085 [Chloroflexota bacterium]